MPESGDKDRKKMTTGDKIIDVTSSVLAAAIMIIVVGGLGLMVAFMIYRVWEALFGG